MLVEWVTMLIVTRQGDCRSKLPPHQRALVAPVHLRKRDILAARAPGLLKVLVQSGSRVAKPSRTMARPSPNLASRIAR